MIENFVVVLLFYGSFLLVIGMIVFVLELDYWFYVFIVNIGDSMVFVIDVDVNIFVSIIFLFDILIDLGVILDKVYMYVFYRNVNFVLIINNEILMVI